MNKALDRLPALVEEEFKEANKVHPSFASLHEGYAVMLEERDETQDELLMLNDHIKLMWAYIKRDDEKKAKEAAENVQQTAMRLAAEAIQVAAMAQKIRCGEKTGRAEEYTGGQASPPSERRRRPEMVFAE